MKKKKVDFNGNYNAIPKEDRKEKSDFIDINICGARYSLLKNQIRKFPGSVLSRLSYIRRSDDVCHDELPDGVEWNSSMNEFVINRTPRLFDIVLQYYINGKLHIPKWACKEEISDELAFWDLTATNACKKCCGKTLCDNDDSADDGDGDGGQQYSKLLINRRRGTYFQMYSKWGSMKRNVRHFLEQPQSSLGAKIYAGSFIFVIFLSVLNFAIGTVNELQFCPNVTSPDDEDLNISSLNENETYKIKPFSTVMQDYFDVNGDNFFSSCDGTKVFQAIDLFCLIFFTLDLILRIFSCQRLLYFLSSRLRTIELIVVVPYYVEIILWSQQVTVNESWTLFFILRLFQTIRILNVFKLARYLVDLKILFVAMMASKREMCMLLLFVFVAVFLGSTIVYQFEAANKSDDNPFTSVIISCWWGIVTLAAVGYGDMVPVTIGGKIAASFVCVMGLLIVAFPMAVLVEHFRNAYKKNKKNKNLTMLQRATKQKDEEKRKKSMSKMNEIHIRILSQQRK